MKRRTVSLSEDAVEALERLAAVHDTTVSGPVEGAARLIADSGGHAEALAERLVPDRRGPEPAILLTSFIEGRRLQLDSASEANRPAAPDRVKRVLLECFVSLRLVTSALFFRAKRG